jgi:hypothetical protein
MTTLPLSPSPDAEADVSRQGAAEPEWVPVDSETATRIRIAANVHGFSESQVIAIAVQRLGLAVLPSPSASTERQDARAPNRRDRWAPIPVVAIHRGVTVEGTYVAAVTQLTVTSGPLAGTSFTSPSGAARAVVAAITEKPPSPVNGWRLWRDAETGQRLEVYRSA